MKRCLACAATYPAETASCPACGAGTVVLDGFPAYAPELSREGGGFQAGYFADLARLEEGHFWFTARNRLIIWALATYGAQARSFLESGCGTGYVLSGIAKARPGLRLCGSEIFSAGLAFAAARVPWVELMQMDARRIAFEKEFDVIGAFDVLEHIEEDQQVLAQMHDALKPDGLMLLSVPQHRWLWSRIDEYACHVRRYDSGPLHRIIKGAGFEILRSTSFVSALFPAMLASRLVQKMTSAVSADALAELRIAPSLNNLLGKVLDAEVAMIRCGANFPVGGSRFIVARKR